MNGRFIWIWLCGSLLGLCMEGCQSDPTGSSATSPTTSDTLALVQAYCGGCHQVPEPSLIPQDIWADHVLPTMGAMLGHYDPGREGYQRADLIGLGAEGDLLQRAGIFPESPLMAEDAWTSIQAYYLAHAPEALPDTGRVAIADGLSLFRPQPASMRLSPPSSTLLQASFQGQLFLGDANTQSLYVLDPQGQILQAAKLKEGAVHMQETAEAIFVTVMGSFSPTDQPTGFIISLPKVTGQRTRVILDSLKRPVHSQLADLNGDGRTDVLVCEYGKWTGQLNWYEQIADGSFTRHTLRNRPGATRAYVLDYDQDEDLDIVALMAQGDEGIFLYEQASPGTFKERALLTFPSSYGSSYFGLHDLNGDGQLDILYTNGDNADYRPILKPYHGVRIFLNNGDWTFWQSTFLPQHGAYKAIPADFDGDGDLDIASISFFPDYAHEAPESFVYWEQGADGQYSGKTFAEATSGRWLTMTAGDLDADGDIDLALGSLTFEVPGDTSWVSRWVQGGLPYLWLENQSK